MTFPTTLSEISPAGVDSIYAEYRGMRYIVGHAQRYHEALDIANQYKACFPDASLFITDKRDSTQINGAWNELEAAYRA